MVFHPEHGTARPPNDGYLGCWHRICCHTEADYFRSKMHAEAGVCVCVCVCVEGGCLVIAMELSVTPASFFQPGCRAPTPVQPLACHLAVVGTEMPCAMNEANPTSSWMRHLVLPAPLWTAASWTALLLTTQWISCGLLWAQG